jgi:hypothetical protein
LNQFKLFFKIKFLDTRRENWRLSVNSKSQWKKNLFTSPYELQKWINIFLLNKNYMKTINLTLCERAISFVFGYLLGSWRVCKMNCWGRGEMYEFAKFHIDINISMQFLNLILIFKYRIKEKIYWKNSKLGPFWNFI